MEHRTDIQKAREKRLGDLRNRRDRVESAYPNNPGLSEALDGLYYSMKSVKFVPPLHDALMKRTRLINKGNGDEAGYFAEALIRSVHSGGDLLARVIVESGQGTCSGLVGLNKQDFTTTDKTLKKMVDDLTGDDAWKYLNAFTNTAKHNYYIQRTSRKTRGGHEIVFKGFTYRSDPPYPEKSFTEVLTYIETVWDFIDDILGRLIANAPRNLTIERLVNQTQTGTVNASFIPQNHMTTRKASPLWNAKPWKLPSGDNPPPPTK